MPDPFVEARKRQLARLGGAKPPAPRAAMALAKSQPYQDAADAPATLRAYASDLATYKAWCERHGFEPMPATPEVVGAYLAAAGEGYALPTLRRRVAAIARACGVAGRPLDTKHPAIRETLRGIGRKHGAPARRSAALTTAEVKKLSRACGTDLAGARDRALFLVGFAGALRRSELVALDVEHVTWTDDGMKLLIERSKTDAEGEGAEIVIPRGQSSFDVKNPATRLALKPVANQGFGDPCRQILPEVDDLEGARRAGEPRDPEASGVAACAIGVTRT